LLKINKNRPTFAWKVWVYIIKRAAAQAAFSSQKVYHVSGAGFSLRVLVLAFSYGIRTAAPCSFPLRN
jgi:hypothetical protein